MCVHAEMCKKAGRKKSNSLEWSVWLLTVHFILLYFLTGWDGNMFNFLFVCVFFIREWQVGRTVRCSSAWADREGCVQGEGGQKALPLLFTHHTHLRLHSRLLLSCSFSWSIRYHGVAGTRQSNISSFLFDFWPHLSSRIHWGRGASGRLMSRSSCID